MFLIRKAQFYLNRRFVQVHVKNSISCSQYQQHGSFTANVS